MTYTYGAIDPLADAARYTDLATVKERLGIPDASAIKDDRITRCIISGELAIDQHLGRSFPDTGATPEIEGIPESVIEAATAVAVAIYKEGDAAGGIAGSEEGFGEVVFDIAGREIRRNPLLVGFRIQWGVG